MAEFNEKEMHENLLKLATRYQQNYYELLPDWFEYTSSDYQYIKQNVAFALFGPPETDGNETVSASAKKCILNNELVENVFNETMYDKKCYEIVNRIYTTILKYGNENGNSPVHVGIIYNVIFHVNKKQSNSMCAIPVFKIKNKYSTWYIDDNSRVYKNWKDYLLNNKLPTCVMVLPKDGIYQCNPVHRVTSNSSNVWIEVQNSPACATKSSVLKVVDIASNVLAVGATIGVAATSLVTPVGPALLTAGLLANGVSGAWTIARSSQQLVDRNTHKESISLQDKRALSAWLGITGSALALGANGGTMLLSRALAKGNQIGSVAKAAYNSMIIGNLTVNGVSVIYQGHCLIGKYREARKVDIVDIIVFSTNILFFSNIVLRTKLAGELIGTSKGTLLEKFKNALRFNRFRQEFNRVTNSPGTPTQSKSRSIIRHLRKITNREDFLSSLNKINSTKNIRLNFQNGKIMINNVELLDPVLFIGQLLTAGTVGFSLTELNSPLANNANNIMSTLKKSLLQLINEFFCKNESLEKKDAPDVTYFYDILNEIKFMNNATSVLEKIFRISGIVIKRCNKPEIFLVDAVYFVWEYSKANLKDYSRKRSSSRSNNFIHDALTKIITFVYEVIDVIGDELFQAFYTYTLSANSLRYE